MRLQKALEGHPPPQSTKGNIFDSRSPKKVLSASAFDGDRFVGKGSRRRSCALAPDVS
jgi:hypothetical protein